VIADFDVTAAMLGYFIKKAIHSRGPLVRLFAPQPSVVNCVPAEITSVEERAIRAAAKLAGAKRVELIASPLAAAVGAGLPIDEPLGSMVADIGGGTTDVPVIVWRYRRRAVNHPPPATSSMRRSFATFGRPTIC
jgi:rod shape-determining protein MreB